MEMVARAHAWSRTGGQQPAAFAARQAAVPCVETAELLVERNVMEKSGALLCAKSSADGLAVPQIQPRATPCVEMGCARVARSATTSTQMTAMAAQPPVLLRLGTRVQGRRLDGTAGVMVTHAKTAAVAPDHSSRPSNATMATQ